LFVNPAEKFLVERRGPGVLQAFALLFRQFAGGTEQCRLLVLGVFSEHVPIVLNFCPFEQGR
jgi:hypothetical protein